MAAHRRYKHLLGLPVEFSDLKHIAPSEFSALKNVLTLSDPAMKVEDLLPGTFFVHEDHSVKPTREVQLKPLGRKIQVTNANISECARPTLLRPTEARVQSAACVDAQPTLLPLPLFR